MNNEQAGVEVIGAWIYVLGDRANFDIFHIGLTKNNPMNQMRRHRNANLGIFLEKAYFVPERLETGMKVKGRLLQQFSRLLTDDETLSQWCKGHPANACESIEALFRSWWPAEGLFSVSQIAGQHICYAWEQELDLLHKGPRLHPVDQLPM